LKYTIQEYIDRREDFLYFICIKTEIKKGVKMEVKVNDSNFKEEVLESDIPVLVDYWAEWCYPCRMVAPAVEEIAKEYQGKLKVCKVNVDEAQKTAANYGIMSIPTLSIFKGGKVMEQIVGAVPKAALEEKIKPYIS
jgi:thioredoxin 1